MEGALALTRPPRSANLDDTMRAAAFEPLRPSRSALLALAAAAAAGCGDATWLIVDVALGPNATKKVKFVWETSAAGKVAGL